MSSQIKAEQRSSGCTLFCVELQKTSDKTKKQREQTQTGSNVSRALVYRWHRRYSDDLETPYDSKGAGRPLVITESLTSYVHDALRQDARLTVHDITQQNNIGVGTAHRILIETLNIESMCALYKQLNNLYSLDSWKFERGSSFWRVPV